jgi:photosystem II stability/assembly factor-like uncharacterized protein
MNKGRHFVVLSGLLALSAAFAAPVPVGKLMSALAWRSVGPYTGGRVTTVAGIADQPNVFYMGTAGGGVWKTEDYGQNWRNISDRDFKSNNIGAMAIAPSNPKIIYVGTGDSAPRNTVLTGEGMYKSADGGRKWSYIGLGETHIISWILVAPGNPDIVYVAALGHLFGSNPERGIFKTTDGGKTWKRILYVNDGTGAISIAMDPSNPQVLYAAMWQIYRKHWTFSSGGPGSGIYQTTDGGATWADISHRPGLPTGIFGKVGLAVAPSQPGVVYALIQVNYKGQAGGLFRSDDAGQSWRLVNNSTDITQRAFYYMTVFVDPKDPNTIYLPNVGVYVSHHGGRKLIELHPPHGDNHVLWINPNSPRTFIEGNDGGAAVTQNGGKSWSSEDNQPTGQFYHANLDDQFPFHIYGAQQDRGSVEAPSAVAAGIIPPVWKDIEGGGEMSWVVPTPGRPWVTYGSGYYSIEWREDRRTGLITNVSPWPEYKFGLAGTEIKYRYGWNHHPVVFAPGDAKELLLGANVLFETTDEGIHWKPISPDLTRNDKSKQGRPGGPISADVTGEEMFDTLSSIAFSPLTDHVIWTGSDDGLVFVTTDAGAHWSQVRPPAMPTWSTITCIEPSHTDQGTAYVSASRFDWDDFHPYVYRTTDYGRHWTEISAGLPQDQYIESVRQDPNESNLLVAGTSATVYFSVDEGQHWQPLTLELPAVRVNDLEIQPQQHAVVLATYGRGFWVLDDLQFLEQLGAAQVSSDAPQLFRPQQAWLVTRGGGGEDGPRGPGGQNPAAGAAVFFHLPDDYNGSTPVQLTFSDASGKLIRSFTLHPKAKGKAKPISDNPTVARQQRQELATVVKPGMNRFQWDLAYPDATEVKGIYNSFFAAATPVGPQVVPGTYYATLSYGDATQKQSFVVKLAPTLQTTPAQLQQRFDLLMRLHAAVDRLDSNLNQAIAARSALAKAVAGKSIAAGTAQAVLSRLSRDIDGAVDLKIQSSEGALVYPPRLREWLTLIADQVRTAFVAPTPAMAQVAAGYIADAAAVVPRLQSDVAVADRVLKH